MYIAFSVKPHKIQTVLLPASETDGVFEDNLGIIFIISPLKTYVVGTH